MRPCLCLSSATARPVNRLQASSPAMNTGRGAFAYWSRRADNQGGKGGALGIHDEALEFFLLYKRNAAFVKVDPAALAEI